MSPQDFVKRREPFTSVNLLKPLAPLIAYLKFFSLTPHATHRFPRSFNQASVMLPKLFPPDDQCGGSWGLGSILPGNG